jgi:hypothetical protein
LATGAIDPLVPDEHFIGNGSFLITKPQVKGIRFGPVDFSKQKERRVSGLLL